MRNQAAEVAQDIIARKSGRDVAEEAFGLALSGVLSGMDGDYERCHQMCTAALAQTNLVKISQLRQLLLTSRLSVELITEGSQDARLPKSWINACPK